jgi:hypothetical protein
MLTNQGLGKVWLRRLISYLSHFDLRHISTTFGHVWRLFDISCILGILLQQSWTFSTIMESISSW